MCHKCAKQDTISLVVDPLLKLEIYLNSLQTSPIETFLGSLMEQGANSNCTWVVTMPLNWKPAHLEIDTVDAMTISLRILKEIGHPLLSPPQRNLLLWCSCALGTPQILLHPLSECSES